MVCITMKYDNPLIQPLNAGFSHMHLLLSVARLHACRLVDMVVPITCKQIML